MVLEVRQHLLKVPGVIGFAAARAALEFGGLTRGVSTSFATEMPLPPCSGQRHAPRLVLIAVALQRWLRSTKATRMRFSMSELVAGLGAGLELGRADTLSFVGVVIALYLVRKSSELFCMNVRVELDNQGALSVSIAP
ncbi:MAG: hypothetical protein GEV13_36370 [Rhodospirillales bacterium]|nr:hypothetical protein [Rhodospirillales bacterium]